MAYALLGFVGFLLVAGTALRIRKLARDKRVRESIGVDPRPRHQIPPAPEPVKSFRRLQGNEPVTEFVIERPRIDPVKRQFFDDGEDRYEQSRQPVVRGRHNNDWLLDRSRHRSNTTRWLMLVVVGAAVVVAGSGIAYYLLNHSTRH